MTDNEDVSRLLESLEQAIQAARNLEFRDLESILKMAVLELLNIHASQGPKPEPVELTLAAR
jgi:hypothetical protein